MKPPPGRTYAVPPPVTHMSADRRGGSVPPAAVMQQTQNLWPAGKRRVAKLQSLIQDLIMFLIRG